MQITWTNWPIASMYGLFIYIYHKNQPNLTVGKYTIHGWYGWYFASRYLPFCWSWMGSAAGAETPSARMVAGEVMALTKPSHQGSNDDPCRESLLGRCSRGSWMPLHASHAWDVCFWLRFVLWSLCLKLFGFQCFLIRRSIESCCVHFHFVLQLGLICFVTW